MPPPADTGEDDESLREQLSALRELIEGYRESHRALYSQIKAARAQRDEAEQHFWSMVARAEGPPRAPSLPAGGDPFGDLVLEDLPPPTARHPTHEVHSSEIISHLQAEVRSLNQEIHELTEANKDLLMQLDEAQKNSQPMPSLAGGASQDELESLKAILSRKNAELVRVSDQNRRMSVDIELFKCQVEEDEQEKATLQRRLIEAQQAVSELQRAHGASAAPPAEPLEQAIIELQRLVAGLALGLGRATRWEPHALTAARRGLLAARTIQGLSGPELELVTHALFPSEQRPAEPDLGDPTALSIVHDDEDEDHENVDESELLGSATPPAVAALSPAAPAVRAAPASPAAPAPAARAAPVSPVAPPPASTVRPSTRPPPLPGSPSSPPPFPSAAPPAAGAVPARLPPMPGPPSIPPSADLLSGDPFAEGDAFGDPFATPQPASRNKTTAWGGPGADPPSSKPMRQRTMLGFEAPPEQLAEQKKLATEGSPPQTPSSRPRKP